MEYRIIWHLPHPCECVTVARPSVATRFLYLAHLEERKGILQLMEAWQAVSSRVAEASLAVVGKGPLLPAVQKWAHASAAVELFVDPPPLIIHEQLRSAQILVLPSQPSNYWTEQVGLPITEGLAHGCRIIATGGTGLADWLRDHGHVIVREAASVQELVAAMLTACDGSADQTMVLSSLPRLHGRAAADQWLREVGQS
ncbi:glycosyltransferase [Blastococcus sp. SYSU DS0973]